MLACADPSLPLGYPMRSCLPSDARVGTVDKFQGQQAETVIVSMTTSGADDMPRDASFLLSRNRLNVAISRARCLAILVASPGLLDLVANSVDEMRLANLFCWAAAFSRNDGSELPVGGSTSNVSPTPAALQSRNGR